jgi:hypothetical protein
VGSAPAEHSTFDAPLNFSRTAREAWRFYRLRPLPLFCLFAATYLFSAVVGAAISTLGRGDAGQALGGIAVNVMLPIWGSIATAVACIVMHDAWIGQTTGLRSALSSLGGSWKEVLSAALLASVAVVICSTILFVLVQTPLALLSLLLIPALPILLFGPPILIHSVTLERLLLVQAWPRARALMSGNWGRLLGHWGLLMLAIGIAVLVSNLIPRVFGAGGFVLAAVTVLAYGVLIPYVVAFVLVSFLDVRAQHDGKGSAQASA